MRGEELAHGLLALAAHDDVEVLEKGLGVAGGQRAAGDEQAAAATQLLANRRQSSSIVAMQ